MKEVNKLVDLPFLVVDDNASNRRILQEDPDQLAHGAYARQQRR